MDEDNNKNQMEDHKKEEQDLIQSTRQDSSFDIELEYEVPPAEPYDKNRINTEHL